MSDKSLPWKVIPSGILLISLFYFVSVRIEEIEDEQISKEYTKDTLKKKKKDEEQQKAIYAVNGAVGGSKSISDANKNESNQKLIEETNHISESEDGDGFPIRMKRKRSENNQAEPLPKAQVIEGYTNANNKFDFFVGFESI